MASVEELFATLGLRVKESEWSSGDRAIDKTRKKLLETQVRAQQRSERASREAQRAVQSLARQEDREARTAQRAVQVQQRKEERVAAQTAKANQRAERDQQKSADRIAAQTAKSQAKTEKEQQKSSQRAALNELRSWQKAGRERQASQQKDEDERKAKRDALVQRTQTQGRVLSAVVGGFAMYFGQKAVRAGIEFNSSMEESKNQVAGMMALTKKTHLADELKNADTLVENLSRRAAELPGTTAEYVHMLGMITKPIMDAKLGMKDLEDLTVNAVVASKAFGIAPDVAARDVDQALRGQYHSVDPFSGKVLGSIGYAGEEGRRKYNQLSAEKRASEYKRGLLAPQIAELGAAQGKGFKGVLSTLEDAWQRFMGKVTEPLFRTLIPMIIAMNKWLDENKTTVKELADVIGGALMTAFTALVTVIKFFLEHGDLAKAMLIGLTVLFAAMAIAEAAALWPIYLIVAAIALVAYGVIKLIKHWDDVKDAGRRAWEAIKNGFSAAFAYLADLPVIKQLIWLAKTLGKLMGIGDTLDTKTAKEHERALAGNGLPMQTVPSDIERKLMDVGALPRSGRDGFRLPGSTATNAAPSGMTINGGVSVQVNSPNADPGQVAAAVGKHFDDKMGNMLRRNMDVVK